MGFKPLLVGLLLAGLLAYAMIMGGMQLAAINNPNQSITQDPAIAQFSSSLNQSLERSYTDANASLNSISTSPVSLTSGGIIFDSMSGIWKTMKVVPLSIYYLISSLVDTEVLGGAQTYIVWGIIGSIILLGIVFGVWKLVSTGEENR